jgi:hypothetical protein
LRSTPYKQEIHPVSKQASLCLGVLLAKWESRFQGQKNVKILTRQIYFRVLLIFTMQREFLFINKKVNNRRVLLVSVLHKCLKSFKYKNCCKKLSRSWRPNKRPNKRTNNTFFFW